LYTFLSFFVIVIIAVCFSFAEYISTFVPISLLDNPFVYRDIFIVFFPVVSIPFIAFAISFKLSF